MSKFERKIIEFIEKNWMILGFLVITILALLARFFVRKNISSDYIVFLEPWYNQLKEGGGLAALANYPGDYNAPYMTILALLTYTPLSSMLAIKLVSVAFDFALAIAAVMLVRQVCQGLVRGGQWILLVAYAAVLFLPTVLMNSAAWGQCDSIYATFAILSILFLLKEKHLWAFVMLGMAFSFKLQAVFLLPLFVILYFYKKNFSVLHFFIIPIMDLVLCLPALIMGWPMKNLLLVYFSQTQTYNAILASGFPSIAFIMNGDPGLWGKGLAVLTMAILFICLVVSLRKKLVWNAERILGLAIFTITIATFTLPYMHERYAYVGEILTLIYFIVYRKNFLLAMTVLITPIVTYSIFLFGLNWDYKVISIIYGALLIFCLKDLAKDLWGAQTRNSDLKAKVV